MSFSKQSQCAKNAQNESYREYNIADNRRHDDMSCATYILKQQELLHSGCDTENYFLTIIFQPSSAEDYQYAADGVQYQYV